MPAALRRYEAARLERTAAIVRGSSDNTKRFHNKALGSPEGAAAYVEREFQPEKVKQRYDWLYEYDALTVALQGDRARFPALIKPLVIIRAEDAARWLVQPIRDPWSRSMYLPRRLLTLGLAATVIGRNARAAEQATPEEAKALAERAAAHFKEVGAEKAIADFSDAAGGYVDRELFVVVYDPDRRVIGSYGVPALRGKDAATLKDVEGKEFGKEIIQVAKSPGAGWVEYRMTNPATKKVGLKRSWVIGIGDYVLLVGAFGS